MHLVLLLTMPQLQDELLARDKSREQDMAQLKIEMQQDYDEVSLSFIL